MLDLKLKDFNTALDEQKKQYETKYSTDVENLILSRRKSEITVQETKKELEKLRSEFDLLSSTSSLDKNEIILKLYLKKMLNSMFCQIVTCLMSGL